MGGPFGEVCSGYEMAGRVCEPRCVCVCTLVCVIIGNEVDDCNVGINDWDTFRRHVCFYI